MRRKNQYTLGEILCEKTGVTYICDDEAKNDHRFVKAECSCGEAFIARVDLIKKGKICPSCTEFNKQHTKNRYVEGDIINQIGSIFLEYTTKNNHGEWFAKIRCGKCGNIYEGRISHAKENCACTKCKTNKEDNRKINPGDIIIANNGLRFLFLKNEPSKIFNSRATRYGKFVLIDENNNIIGNPFIEQLGHIKTGKYTGLGRSIGEYKCNNILQELGWNYQKEYAFDDLYNDKTSAKLYFDFVVFFTDRIVALELDGEQHFKVIDYFGGEEGFKELQYRDGLKNEYCKSNNIDLYKIPYYDYNKISVEYLIELLGEESF